ncbi:MAG: hypothetical protein IK016_09505 [Lachnospiraceae bacterium]|nr:hypothetical protein [Lachnospiraceae bacterium]
MKVSRRGGFSDRNGIKPENREIQLTEFDKRTRVQLQNMISSFYSAVYGGDLYYSRPYVQSFIRFVMGTIYSVCIDEREIYDDDMVVAAIHKTILEDEYDDVLTLIEALIQYWDKYLRLEKGCEYYDEYSRKYRETSIYEQANRVFKREYIGYRFVNQIIVKISDSYEIDAIRETLDTKHKPVYDHISKANKLLADRDNPDYENSIKESISAVEAMGCIITGAKGKEATLGKVLKKMEENGVDMHKGLQSAFEKLYGYTSDANGIRHAGDIGSPSSTFEEAKFMLVTCCAFINYLTALCAD